MDALEQVIFRVDALHGPENRGIKVINLPGTMEKAVDNYYTSSRLEDTGLPATRTMVRECFARPRKRCGGELSA